MNRIIDCLINKCHCTEDIKTEAKNISEELGLNLDKTTEMITHWIEDRENLRSNIKSNLSKDSSFCTEELMKFINKYDIFNEK